MRRIIFRIENRLPPKKDGANSMWNKGTEAPRLVALRHRALEALDSNPLFSQDICLKVTIYASRGASGDLDNFITGICDGLMQANPRAKLHEQFGRPENASIHPSKTIAIEDDSQIIEICARKVVGDSADSWYEVELSGN